MARSQIRLAPTFISVAPTSCFIGYVRSLMSVRLRSPPHVFWCVDDRFPCSGHVSGGASLPTALHMTASSRWRSRSWASMRRRASGTGRPLPWISCGRSSSSVRTALSPAPAPIPTTRPDHPATPHPRPSPHVLYQPRPGYTPSWCACSVPRCDLPVAPSPPSPLPPPPPPCLY